MFESCRAHPRLEKSGRFAAMTTFPDLSAYYNR